MSQQNFQLWEAMDKIRQRFWGMKGRDPSCGLISLKKVAILFAYFNMIRGLVGLTACAIYIFVFPVLAVSYRRHHNHTMQPYVHPQHHESAFNREIQLSIRKIESRSCFVQLGMYILMMTWASYYHWSWKLACSIKEGNTRGMKFYFVWALSLAIFSIPGFLYEEERFSALAFILDAPIFLFQLFAAMATHAYIVTFVETDETPAASPSPAEGGGGGDGAAAPEPTIQTV